MDVLLCVNYLTHRQFPTLTSLYFLHLWKGCVKMVYYMHDVQDEGFELVELTDHWNWKD